MLGERMKAVRKASGLSQVEFSSRLSVTRNTIAKYETNCVKPSDLFLSYLCKVFNVNKEWLLSGVGEMQVSCNREAIQSLESKLHELDQTCLPAINQLVDSMIHMQNKKD